MSHEAIDNWIERAKSGDKKMSKASKVKVIKREQQTKGNMIMDIAEKIRPWLSKMFEGVRDENGMVVQPARVRGIALNMAQHIVHQQEQK